jgi:hypothetical protein
VRAIARDASPSAIAAAMAEELEAQRAVPDWALPDWDDCAQTLSEVYDDVYNDILSSRFRNRPPLGGILSWPPETKARRR